MAADFLARTAQAQPDAPALDDGVRDWSYRELEQRVSAAAYRLQGVVATGSTVALISETTGSNGSAQTKFSQNQEDLQCLGKVLPKSKK